MERYTFKNEITGSINLKKKRFEGKVLYVKYIGTKVLMFNIIFIYT